MAGMTSTAFEQLRAIAILRLQLSLNSLRSVRGQLNLISRVIAGLLIVGAGVGGGIAFGVGAWAIVHGQSLAWLALLFWGISIFWQLFPVMASALTQSMDVSSLLRFPLSYPSFFVIRMIYGALDIPTALGMCWSLGLFVGICVGNIRLLPWAVCAVGAMVVLNLLLSRLVFVWIEHWLSLRRSREVIGVIFILMIVCSQLIGPMLGRYGRRLSAMPNNPWLARMVPVERALPPGLSSSVIEDAAAGRSLEALLAFLALAGYGAAILLPLHLRLRKQFAGEAVSSGDARKSIRKEQGALRPGWKLPFASGQASAVFEKELHYYSRSGPMLFTLIMPVVMIIILWGGRKGFFSQQSEYLFPVGAAYCLLVLNNILYNSFGGDAGGIQFLLFSPVPFRKIMAGKNLAQLAVLAAEVLVLWIGVTLIYQAPHLASLALTLAWYLFAAPLNFTAGNMLSVYSPKRIDYSTFGRQRASETAIFASLAVQFTGIGVGALAVVLAHHYGQIWIATLALLALGVPSLIAYLLLLRRMDSIVLNRREVLATELCRAQLQ